MPEYEQLENRGFNFIRQLGFYLIFMSFALITQSNTLFLTNFLLKTQKNGQKTGLKISVGWSEYE